MWALIFISASIPWMPPVRISASPPSEATLESIAKECSGARLSAYVGRGRALTRSPGAPLPEGLYHVSRSERTIGRGAKAFRQAAEALEQLAPLELSPWLTSARTMPGA